MCQSESMIIFKFVSIWLNQVAVKVQTLSGFTYSLLRPHVFPQAVSVKFIFHIPFFTLLCLAISDVLSIDIVDYLEWSYREVYDSVSKNPIITCWLNLGEGCDVILQKPCGSSCGWLGKLRWNCSRPRLYQGTLSCSVGISICSMNPRMRATGMDVASKLLERLELVVAAGTSIW